MKLTAIQGEGHETHCYIRGGAWNSLLYKGGGHETHCYIRGGGHETHYYIRGGGA